MGSVFRGSPIDVRALLALERLSKNPNLEQSHREKVLAKHASMLLEFDTYLTELSTKIDYNKQLKNKGVDPDTLIQPKEEEPKPKVVYERAKRLKVKTGELV